MRLSRSFRRILTGTDIAKHITLKQRLAKIAAPYKACAKKLGLKYKNRENWTWKTRVKVRNCVMTIRRKKGL